MMNDCFFRKGSFYGKHMSNMEQLTIAPLFKSDNAEPEIKVLSAQEIRDILDVVIGVLKEHGFDPYRQISGYIISDDPAYIPDYNDARSILCRVDRDTLLGEIIRYYFEGEQNGDGE